MTMPQNRYEGRTALGDAAVFSLNKAAELLPIGDSEARAWLKESGLVRSVNGRPVVLWRDVLSAISRSPIWTGKE
jgi:hypothetical protein